MASEDHERAGSGRHAEHQPCDQRCTIGRDARPEQGKSGAPQQRRVHQQ